MFNLRNITTITTITMHGADMGRWWSHRVIGATIITIITIITTITDIEFAVLELKTGPSGSCFFAL